MEEKDLQILLGKIDVLIRLTALNVTADKTAIEQVEILSSVGLRPIEISRMTDKSLNIVTALLAQSRKRSNKKK